MQMDPYTYADTTFEVINELDMLLTRLDEKGFTSASEAIELAKFAICREMSESLLSALGEENGG